MPENLAPLLATNQPEFTVAELSRAIRSTLEGEFRRVRVRGEISNLNRHRSGHVYFALKDAEAVIDACCWRQTAVTLKLRPEDGMEVIATGRVSTYAGRSKYQLIVDDIELAGEGALLKLLEDRKKRLAAEGLFDESRKKPLPFLPEVIGVVTSASGAVIRDIMHRLRDRFPRRVLLWPVAVQGDAAAGQVAAAIAGFNALPGGGRPPRPDLIIVARGGGSLEDLWAFNEEAVVRAAAASAVPLISAIGHETDFTLLDFAADRRAPTPTAAAEMAVPVRADILAQLLDRERRLVACAGRSVDERRARLEGLARGLPDAASLLAQAVQRLDERSERLEGAAENRLHRCAARIAELGGQLRHPRDQIAAKGEALNGCARSLDHRAEAFLAAARHRLERLAPEQRLLRGIERRLADDTSRLANLGGLLESYSYRGVLARGFALVRQGPHAVTARAEVAPGARLSVTFRDGDLNVTADGAPRPRRAAAAPEDQGRLL